MAEAEKIKLYRSFIYPSIFVIILWLIKGVDMIFNLDLNQYGLYPREVKGLLGIITSPLLHADLSHLFANTVPLLILGTLLFYFYKEIAWMILILLYLVTGFWVWTFARGGAAHIGASGVIYGLAAFLFFSGIIRKEPALMVITLLIAFLYGSLIWGIFPELFPHQHISWESHFMGLLAGLVLAVYYRKAGPQKKVHEWEDEEENDDTEMPSAYSEADPDVGDNKPEN